MGLCDGGARHGGVGWAECRAFQSGVSGAGGGQQDPRWPSACGQQLAPLVWLRVLRQPRRGSLAGASTTSPAWASGGEPGG
jgi:hypothetical protein